MAFSAKVLADSIAPCGSRLTTLEVSYPRFIHSEMLTHRMLSRNSASSRAIPVEKLIQRVVDDPVVPLYIGANQKGMQAGAELPELTRGQAVLDWIEARDFAVTQARNLVALGVHKSIPNRLLEPWMWITVIVSATEWDNFYGLRLHKDAEPHFQHIARMMRDAMDASTPMAISAGAWHLPLWFPEEDEPLAREIVGPTLASSTYIGEAVQAMAIKVSIGRCARVSYLTHDGRRDLRDDVALYERLIVQEPLHASPAEHVAKALDTPERVGNFVGWRQLRKTLPNEHIGKKLP